MLRVWCWLWRQERAVYSYGARDVDVWGAMLARNLSIPHKLGCVTDTPDGIDRSIECIPLPRNLDSLKSDRWPSAKGLPQCFRRLDMWRADAAGTYGDRFASLDLDCVIVDSLDPLFDRPEDVVMCQGKAGKAHYNGSMLLLKAGSRPEVYDRINAAEVEQASQMFLGSDQAWISHVLGPNEPVWTENDGMYRWSVEKFPAPVRNLRNFSFSRRAFPLQELNPKPPENMRILFFAGNYKPRDLRTAYPFIEEHYR